MGKKLLLHHIYQPSKCLLEEEIKHYLLGSLKPDGRRRVENHLLDCPLCSDAVEGFENSGNNRPQFHLLEDFSALTQKLAPQEGGKIRPLTAQKVLLRVAAVVAILLVSYFTLVQPPSGDQLYTQFYTSYPNDIPLETRSSLEGTVLHPLFKEGLQLYAAGKFSESLPLFERALTIETDNDAIRFYAGMASLELQKFEMATGYFDSFKNPQNGYAQKANWYMALAFLKMDDKEAAKKLLDDLIAKGGFNSVQALKLREKL